MFAKVFCEQKRFIMSIIMRYSHNTVCSSEICIFDFIPFLSYLLPASRYLKILLDEVEAVMLFAEISMTYFVQASRRYFNHSCASSSLPPFRCLAMAKSRRKLAHSVTDTQIVSCGWFRVKLRHCLKFGFLSHKI